MKKFIYSALCIAVLSAVGCTDFLEVTSPSEVDGEFVFSNPKTSRIAMDGAYETWRDCASSQVFGDGWYYALDVAGSDIERHPEAWSNQPGRHYPEGLYDNGTYTSQYDPVSYDKDDDGAAYAKLFAVVGKANAVITAMENAENFEEFSTSGQPSEIGQLYGEAIAMRATAYRELIKYFGDVPYNTQFGVPAGALAGRDSIYDCVIADLRRVEPLMYEVGKIPGFTGVKKYFSRTYVRALIGRMALEAGGYQTRRGDLTRVDGQGNPLSFDPLGIPNNGATYGRRTDWQDLYTIAKEYFKKVIESVEAGENSVKFHATDPRSYDGRVYDNPHQYFFQQLHMDDAVYADESIYEYPMQQGGGNDSRPYSYGRPSSGGGSKAYPCKNYGQGRINPAYYYGIFDPKDKRRDVAATVTGSNGKGIETMITMAPGSTTNGGGISLNKFDENRQSRPWWEAQRKSGINGPYMRIAEVYLGYAEACAALGEDSEARTYLDKIRNRAFPAGQANTDTFISKCGGMLKAVIEERGFEYAGEGDRRWTLIRTGLLPEMIQRIKELTLAMINGLEANGYYEFENKNIISTCIISQPVDANAKYGYRLTTQCPDETDPVLYPGWRGQHDDWGLFGLEYAKNPKTNLAIKGLFEQVTPSKFVFTRTFTRDTDAKFGDPDVGKKKGDKIVTDFSGTLVQAGQELSRLNKEIADYNAAHKNKKETVDSKGAPADVTAAYTVSLVAEIDGEEWDVTLWGQTLIDSKDEFYTYLFHNYDYKSAPIYLVPITPNALHAGGLTNGYGFKN